jgi:hypothetical protein
MSLESWLQCYVERRRYESRDYLHDRKWGRVLLCRVRQIADSGIELSDMQAKQLFHDVPWVTGELCWGGDNPASTEQLNFWVETMAAFLLRYHSGRHSEVEYYWYFFCERRPIEEYGNRFAYMPEYAKAIRAATFNALSRQLYEPHDELQKSALHGFGKLNDLQAVGLIRECRTLLGPAVRDLAVRICDAIEALHREVPEPGNPRPRTISRRSAKPRSSRGR